MLTQRQKNVAKAMLLFYVFVSLVFPLAHTDFLRAQSAQVLTPAGAQSHEDDSDQADAACPAHQYEQATTGTPASCFSIFTPTHFSYMNIPGRLQYVVVPFQNLPSRAPPIA
jgi:hypothetical protein